MTVYRGVRLPAMLFKTIVVWIDFSCKTKNGTGWGGSDYTGNGQPFAKRPERVKEELAI
jgi:hypothetical protein